MPLLPEPPDEPTKKATDAFLWIIAAMVFGAVGVPLLAMILRGG